MKQDGHATILVMKQYNNTLCVWLLAANQIAHFGLAGATFKYEK